MRLCNSLSTIHLNAILFGETPARFIWSFALTHGFSDISILSWQWCAFCHTSLDSVPFGSSYIGNRGIAPCFHWSSDRDSKGAEWLMCQGTSEPRPGPPAGGESHHRHHVRRTQLRSVSAVCVRARAGGRDQASAKTAHPLSPSSFRNGARGELPVWFIPPPFTLV